MFQVNPGFLLRFLACLLLVLVVNPVCAQDLELPENDEEWDWILLDSGEVLKGEIRVMYNEKLEFDSDHFGVITIDWEDVKAIRSARRQAIRTNSREIIVGKVTMNENMVQVKADDSVRSLNRGGVVSLASGQLREINFWSFKASVGANVRRGNVEQTDFFIKSVIQRRTALTRFYWDYNGNYSTSEQLEIANNHRSNAYFDYFFSSRFFVRPLSAEYFRDPFQNIAHRQTYSAGLGYTVLDLDKVTVDFTAGPGFQQVEYVTVSEGENRIQSSFGALFTATVDWEVTDWMDFIGTYRVQFAPKDVGGISSHADSTLEVEVTDNLDLNFSIIWDRIEMPQSGEDGIEPERDDFRFVLGIGLDI